MSISIAEVKKHKNAKSAWLIIHNDVYDVSKFLTEHPGGADTLLDAAGKDATRAFDDVGHSEDARRMMKKFKIGTLAAEDRIINVPPCGASTPREKSPSRCERLEPHVSTIYIPRQSGSWWLWVLLAIGVAAAGAFAYKRYS